MYSNQWCHSKSIKQVAGSVPKLRWPPRIGSSFLPQVATPGCEPQVRSGSIDWPWSLGIGLSDRTGKRNQKTAPQKTSFCTRWPANLWAWGIWTLKQTHVEVLNSNDFQQRLSSVSYDPKLDNLMTKFSTKDVFEMVLARHLWAQTSVFSSISSWCLSPANTLGDDAIK